MSDDLISRKDALQVLENVFTRYRMSWGREHGGFGAAVKAVIEELPTAFDKEKVMDELHNAADLNVGNGLWNVELQDALEIIEKGGIE